MKRLEFECKLLSDVVIKSTPATEGFDENLDYIPGTKFLGIVAKQLYNTDKSNETLDIFHNGNVCFSDAHLKIENKRCLKVPFNWFYNKGNGLSDKIYLHHKITSEQKKNFSKNEVQLKQARKGYFSKNKFISIENNFAIKSAYDTKKRKAEDEKIYGYFSFPKGSDWLFYVDTKEEYAEEIKEALTIGRKRIGRSRSAEYGLVKISFIDEISEKRSVHVTEKELLIYAESNLCFYDEYGQNTLQPTIEQLNLPDNSEIIWEKSQIRTRKYQTWNGKRYNRDADRMIIEKGSVFFIKLNSEISLSVFENGLGSHKNEGFGRVLANPKFLSENISLTEHELTKNQDNYPIEEGEKDKLLQIYLANQEIEKKREEDVDKLVNNFKSKYKNIFKGITASQWGQVRNYAKYATNEDILKKLLFKDEFGYFMHGQSESKWRANNRRGILKDFIFEEKNGKSEVPKGSRIEFTQKLAAEMGKYAKTKTKKS